MEDPKPHWAAVLSIEILNYFIHSAICCLYQFKTVHAEQVTDFPSMFLHIAWELILACRREDDSLEGGC